MPGDSEALTLLTFDVADLRMAIELSRVLEIALRPEVVPLPGVPAPITGVVRWRGQALAAVELRSRLRLPSRAATLFDHLIVVQTERRRLALEVDRVREIESIARADVRGAPPSADAIAGIVVLPSGVHYIIGLEALLALEEERAFDDALASSGKPS